MFKFLTLKEETFGLDINDFSLKIVKLNKKQKGFDLVSFNETKIPPGIIEEGLIKNEDALAKLIKLSCEKVKGKKIGTKYVIASLPEEKSFLQVIQMPKMSEDELALAVPLEAENYIPMPIDEVYLDFQVISPVRDYLNNLEVLIVAMPKKVIDSYVSCFKKAGLRPIIIEVESEAITRALVRKGTKSSLLIMIDFGENNTDFIIFSGESIRFTCSIPVSARSLTEAISKTLQISFDEAESIKTEFGLLDKDEATGISVPHTNPDIAQIMAPILEDLVSQIKKYLNFYRDHSSYEYLLDKGISEKILLCGGGAQLKGLAEFLSKKLEASVEVGDPLINFSTNKTESVIRQSRSSFTTAIGLALRDVNNHL